MTFYWYPAQKKANNWVSLRKIRHFLFMEGKVVKNMSGVFPLNFSHFCASTTLPRIRSLRNQLRPIYEPFQYLKKILPADGTSSPYLSHKTTLWKRHKNFQEPVSLRNATVWHCQTQRANTTRRFLLMSLYRRISITGAFSAEKQFINRWIVWHFVQPKTCLELSQLDSSELQLLLTFDNC